MSKKWSEIASREQVWVACLSLAVKYGTVVGAVCGTLVGPGDGTILGAIVGAIGGGVAGLIATTIDGTLGWGLAGAVGGSASVLIIIIILGWSGALSAAGAVLLAALIGWLLGVGIACGVQNGNSRLPGVQRLAAVIDSAARKDE
jgi:hypothetical protein